METYNRYNIFKQAPKHLKYVHTSVDGVGIDHHWLNDLITEYNIPVHDDTSKRINDSISKYISNQLDEFMMEVNDDITLNRINHKLVQIDLLNIAQRKPTIVEIILDILLENM